MSKSDFLFKQVETIVGWYKQAEEKAKFLVGLNTVAAGAVNGIIFVGADKIRAVRDVYSTPVWLLLGLSGAALVGSYLYILWAMWPRHHVRTLTASAAENLWFFGDIAAMSKDEHRNAMSKWAEPDVVAMLVSQNYILSKNVWVKHEALNRAILLTIAALVLLLALGLVYGVAMARGPLPQG